MYTINIIVFLICAGCYYGMTENVEENNRTKKWRTEKIEDQRSGPENAGRNLKDHIA